MTHPRAGQDIHRFIFETSSQLRHAGDPDKVLRHYLRAASDFMQADRGYVAALDVGDETARCIFAQPPDAAVNLALVMDLLRGKQCRIPAGTLCARISRRGRAWGMMVLERDDRGFADGSPRGLAHIARALTENIERLDRERLSEVRGRIDDMILRELPPKDLLLPDSGRPSSADPLRPLRRAVDLVGARIPSSSSPSRSPGRK